jgi:diguanylate cyclase (GGDEF)-like protein
MITSEQKQHLKHFTIYIGASIGIFSCLTILNAYVTHNQLLLVNFFIPITASLIVGFLLAKNKILELELITLANTDKLTMACNRQYFDLRLTEETQIARRYKQVFSVIFFDLDHFKKVNDQYGHAEGDLVLIEFSAIIKNMNRDTDLFARYGGEEFVLLAKMANRHTANEIYLRIKNAIDKHTFGKVGNITFSAGIAEFDCNNDTTESIIKRADKALYKAKEAGRNQAVTAD